MNKAYFLLPLLLLSCAHNEPDRSAEEAAAISLLSAPDAQTQLVAAEAELTELDDRIRSTQSRRDNFRIQASSDPNKQGAVDGMEAELAGLQAKRAKLLHRQHLLQGRLRELEK